MKPTPELINEWCVKAKVARLNDPQPGVYEYTLAELAASWGAEQAQQTTEPELPKAVAYEVHRAMSEPYLSSFKVKEALCNKPLFTATQMHDHFAAGVRAGAAQQSQDAKRYQWLRGSGFAHANVDLGTDLDGDNFVRYQIRFDIPEPAHSKFEDDEWSASDIDAAIDAAMQGGKQ